MSLVLDEHREYLSDPHRVEAFRRALEEVVRPGDVVLDLGSGTGILGLLACRAGAGRVYAVEEGGIIELAREVAAASGFADRIVFVPGLSTRVELPERVDLVVTDQIGHFGFEAGLVEYLSDVTFRFLKPGGTLVPGRIDLHVAPTESADVRARVDFWSSSPAGFDYRPARSIAVNTGYPIQLESSALLATPAHVATFDFGTDIPSRVSGEGRFEVRREGRLDGIGGWFSAPLSRGVELTNSPGAPHRIARRNVFLPLEEAVPVRPGDEVALRLAIVPRSGIVHWSVEAAGRRFRHSTWQGMLLPREALRRTRPDHRPTLTRWGRARLLALSLADGRRPLREIEDAVLSAHPDLFPTREAAALFAGEAIRPDVE